MFQFNKIPNLEGYYEKVNWIPAQKEYECEFDYGIQIQLNNKGTPDFKFKNRNGIFEPAEMELVEGDLENGSWFWIRILKCSREELNRKEITMKNPSKEIVDGFNDLLETWEIRFSISKAARIETNSIDQQFLTEWTSWFNKLATNAFPTAKFPAKIIVEEFLSKEFSEPFSGFIAFKNINMRKKEGFIKDAEFDYSIELNEFEVKSFEEQFNMKLEDKGPYSFENLIIKIYNGKRFLSIENSGNELKIISNILKTKDELKTIFSANPLKAKCSVPNW